MLHKIPKCFWSLKNKRENDQNQTDPQHAKLGIPLLINLCVYSGLYPVHNELLRMTALPKMNTTSKISVPDKFILCPCRTA